MTGLRPASESPAPAAEQSCACACGSPQGDSGGLEVGLQVPERPAYTERTPLDKRFDLCVPCYFMKSPAPPHRSKHCLVPRALRQEATIYSSQKDFLRPRAAEDLLPIQKRSRFCFPPEPLRPHEEDSLTASGSKGRRVTSSESFLTSPPPLTVVRACAWWRGGQKVGPIVLCSPCPGPLQPVRLVKGKPSPIVFLRPDSCPSEEGVGWGRCHSRVILAPQSRAWSDSRGRNSSEVWGRSRKRPHSSHPAADKEGKSCRIIYSRYE